MSPVLAGALQSGLSAGLACAITLLAVYLGKHFPGDAARHPHLDHNGRALPDQGKHKTPSRQPCKPN
jgi:hypothetical protein